MTKVLKHVTCECLSKGVFTGLREDTKECIRSIKVTNQHRKGYILYHQGNPAFGIYCITSGKIKITKTGNDGKVVIIKIAGPGDILGHTNLYSNENHTTTATVIEEAVVCFIEKKVLIKKIEEDPMVSIKIIKKLSDDMVNFESKSAAMSHKNVKERLAELLLMLKDSYGIFEQGRLRLDIKLTREEMASMVGTANETVIRFITEFKEAGIIKQEGKILYIMNEEKLRKL